MSKATDSLPVKIPRVGRNSKKILKTLLVSSLIAIMMVSSIGNWLPGLVTLFGGLFLSNQQQIQTTCSPNPSNLTGIPPSLDTPCRPPVNPTHNNPTQVGAGHLPNLSLPQEVVSGLGNIFSTSFLQS